MPSHPTPRPRDPIIDALAGIAVDALKLVLGIGIFAAWTVAAMGGAEAMRGWF